jgi:adenylate cyclase
VTETSSQRLIRNEVYKVPDPLAPESIRSAVDRAVESPQLDSCPSLCRFLRYVVEETLAGRGANIKEYSLGLEVFHRGDSFDPRLDPIVRVQARNLRIRLARYYAGPGANHPLRIELPKRTYVPVFHVMHTDEIHSPHDLSRAMLLA